MCGYYLAERANAILTCRRKEVSGDCSVIETGTRHVPLLLSSFEVLTVKAVKGWKMSKIFCRPDCLAEVWKNCSDTSKITRHNVMQLRSQRD